MKTTVLAITALTLALTSCQTTPPVATGSAKAYAKSTCIVTGNRLGSMGDPVSYIHEGQEIKVCCSPCIKKFKANPEKFLADL